jgi:hypothetical protein
LILKRTFNKKELAAGHHEPVAFIEIGSDDDIGKPKKEPPSQGLFD